jgi:DnaD/phage-associated family protein
MQGFAGFPKGKLRLTSIPNLFFSDLLPAIDNLAELKVTVYAFWALTQREGAVRFLRLADFLNDPVFIKGLGVTNTEAMEKTIDGVERAVARGTFLHVNVESADGKMDLYFLNTDKGRVAVEGISKGAWRPSFYDDESITLLVERPNVFVLYEQNIGMLTPLIADELRDAEQTYPADWLTEAIELAVSSNVRKWRYVRGILERWRLEGKQDANDRRDFGKTSKKQTNDIPEHIRDVIED